MARRLRFTPAALDDLNNIWFYTAEQWGTTQADRYVRQLHADMELLIENPRLARERPELSPPMRIRHSGSHLIFFDFDDQTLRIVRIAHGRQNWGDWFRE